MTALSENRDTLERLPSIRRYAVKAGEIMYAGGLAALNISTGEVEMASDAANLSVLGRVEERVDNTGDGEFCSVKAGCFKLANSSAHAVTNALLGRKCYVEDDNTVSSDPGTNGVAAGIVFAVDADGVWVSTLSDITFARSATQSDPALGASDMTDSTGGTASGAHAIVGPAAADYSAAELKNNFATLVASHNSLKDDVEAAAAAIGGLIDKLQASGLMK